MMRSILVTAVGLLAFGASTAQAQAPKLEEVTIQFYTTENDKDQDTKVWVYVMKGDTELASKGPFADGTQFEDKTNSDPYMLKIGKGVTKADFEKFKVIVKSQAKGSDKWQFDYKLTLHFAGQAPIVKEGKGCELNSRGNKVVDLSHEFTVK
jgi:hypothetical protein